MLRAPSDTARLVVKTADEFPRPKGGPKMRSVSYDKGSVRMSEYHGIPSTQLEALPPEWDPSMDWEMLTELKAEHGEAVTVRILDEAGLLLLSPAELDEMTEEIRVKLRPEIRGIVDVQKIEEKGIDRETVIVALWAQLFIEPLSDTWLAAMAQYAYFVENDNFAFGYLTAQLDRRKNLESHFLRGKKIVESGRMGGNARASQRVATSERTLSEMSRLVDSGLGITSAARLAYRHGNGKSAEANRRLWNRHRKKVGT